MHFRDGRMALRDFLGLCWCGVRRGLVLGRLCSLRLCIRLLRVVLAFAFLPLGVLRFCLLLALGVLSLLCWSRGLQGHS